MIPHEEIRDIAKDNLHFGVRKTVLDYVSQQEKKDELLGLYQSLDEVLIFNACDIDDIQERIKYINNRSKNRTIIQTKIKEILKELGGMK